MVLDHLKPARLKVVITGVNGMLGTAMRSALHAHELYCFSRKELDITCTFRLEQMMRKIAPDYIINCAAYTAVDQAEDEKDKAFKINSLGAGALAQVAKNNSATLIHFSTDYVFDGKAERPYKVEAATNPINVYGASKCRGEQAIQNTGGSYYIFRTSWLYAPHGKNFFRWVIDNKSKELKVVTTQIGSPTSALDLADFIAHLLKKDPKEYGVYHFVNKGAVSWYDFAQAIVEKTQIDKKISPISDYPTAARRPDYSVLDVALTEDVFEYTIKDVSMALELVVGNEIV